MEKKVILVLHPDYIIFLKALITMAQSPDESGVLQYLKKLAIAIKAIEDYYYKDETLLSETERNFKRINRSPYGRVAKGYKVEGYLNAPYDDCIVRHIDGINRLVAFELDKGIVGIIRVMGDLENNWFDKHPLRELKDKLKSIYVSDKSSADKLKFSFNNFV
jgi:hypothetical protein